MRWSGSWCEHFNYEYASVFIRLLLDWAARASLDSIECDSPDQMITILRDYGNYVYVRDSNEFCGNCRCVHFFFIAHNHDMRLARSLFVVQWTHCFVYWSWIHFQTLDSIIWRTCDNWDHAIFSSNTPCQSKFKEGRRESETGIQIRKAVIFIDFEPSSNTKLIRSWKSSMENY